MPGSFLHILRYEARKALVVISMWQPCALVQLCEGDWLLMYKFNLHMYNYMPGAGGGVQRFSALY